MNQAAAITNGRSLVLALACLLLAFNYSAQAYSTALAPAQAPAGIALSTYISAVDVLATMGLPSGVLTTCGICPYPVIQPVLGDDNTITPFIYTYCQDTISLLDIPIPRFSLNVGNVVSLYFYPTLCYTLLGGYQFVALDASKSTYAAQFYWDCKQAFIYKCKGNLVFDQPTGRCVQGGYLNPSNSEMPDLCSDISENLLLGKVGAGIGTPIIGGTPLTGRSAVAGGGGGQPTKSLGLPLTTLGCESLVRSYIPSYCGTCKKPLVQKVLTSGFLPTDYLYTVCADNGQFSLDIVNDQHYHTFFAPDCRGKTLVAIDPTRTTVASKLYWDCTYGLRLCPNLDFFDAKTNQCTCLENGGDPTKLITGLENCPKTCGAAPPFPVSYLPQKPYTPVIPTAPKAYAAGPVPAYGK